MTEHMDRRSFLGKSLIASTGAALGFSLEEKVLLAETDKQKTNRSPSNSQTKELPVGKIGHLNVSRLIMGGNLTSGIAHSRDLVYVSKLIKSYFTDEKIFETWEIAEECGVNTAILRFDNQVIRLINKYWDERGGKLQWVVQIKPRKLNIEDFRKDIKLAIDNGAMGAYIQGNVADDLVARGMTDVLGEALECIKEQAVIAGIGGHSLEVPIACEKAGMEPDFYLKTLHSPSYWTFNPEKEDMSKSGLGRHDNAWCTRQEETVEFMRSVKRPWIAFKVLAAGAIHPKDAFKYAYDNGADFICAGMFDFQVVEDTNIALETLNGELNRKRAWVV